MAVLPPKPAGLVIRQERDRGSYGAVYSGELDGKPVVVKRIHQLLLKAPNNDKLLRDFYRECRILSTVRHANVVRFIGAYWDEKTKEPLLVMEAAKENLREYLERNKDYLSMDRQMAICSGMAEGLSFLHARAEPIVHRDLKPENVLVWEDGTVKIADFGQSKLLDHPHIYMNSMQPGTIAYMPPEALRKNPRYTSKVDVFSLGVVMLEVSTQSPPSVWLEGIGAVPEVERHKEDLVLLPDTHPLKPLIVWCLQDNHESRPDVKSTHDLVKSLANGLKVPHYQQRICQLEGELRESHKMLMNANRELEMSKSKHTKILKRLGTTCDKLKITCDQLEVARKEKESLEAELIHMKQALSIVKPSTTVPQNGLLPSTVSKRRRDHAPRLVLDNDREIKCAFLTRWIKAPPKCEPAEIKGVFRIENPVLKSRFDQYCATLPSPNVNWHYHGTAIKCNLLQSNKFCSDSSCGICGICQVGFDKAMIGKYPESVSNVGKAFYLALNSSRSHKYTLGFGDMRALLYCQVALGNPCFATQSDNTMTSPPLGYNSVYVQVGTEYNWNWNEVAIYGVLEAILPRYIIVYQKDGIGKLRKDG